MDESTPMAGYAYYRVYPGTLKEEDTIITKCANNVYIYAYTIEYMY